MCENCGCGKPGEFKVHDPHHSHEDDHIHPHEHTHDNDHEHGHDHEHSHSHSHSHDGASYKHSHEHIHDHGTEKEVTVNIDILSENNRLARINREYFEERKILSLNLVSSPGSGKTSILEGTIKSLIAARKIFVIEGDQQTLLDADRIEKAGAPAVQINTGSGCHLDARMIATALKKIDTEKNSLLFIENVGNLVCPALFDLGEFKRVVVISVTEGDDKPLKYPYMFQSSHLCIINKSDLLAYVDFDTAGFMRHARSINPHLQFILMSAKTGEGMNLWYKWIDDQTRALSSALLS